MDNYYTEYGGKRDKKSRSVLLLRLFDVLMTVVTAVVAVTMVVTYLVPYVNPARVWFFPVLGLAAPAIYVATVVLMLYWIIRWRWIHAGILVLIVVVGLFKVSLFFSPELRRIYPGDGVSDRGSIKVMTYNVRSFYGPKGQSSVRDVLQLIGDEDPDVVCIQEFNARLAEGTADYALLDEKYEKLVFGRTEAPDSLYGAPMLILSKYHILHSGTVLTPHTSVWADVLMGEDTVRIFSNHLRSTAINAKDDDYLSNHRFLSDTASPAKIRSIVDRLRENSVLRAAQVDSISKVVEATRGRRIVCGDFNDTPISYVYRTMARGLNDAFSECGQGYSHTFRGFHNTLRIDYVLSSDGFETRSYDTSPVDFSDHHPVIVRLKKTTINN
ncbi:MAG: endonuclease/exonuclease/phosphatase family protein [Alistipes sp.]